MEVLYDTMSGAAQKSVNVSEVISSMHKIELELAIRHSKGMEKLSYELDRIAEFDLKSTVRHNKEPDAVLYKELIGKWMQLFSAGPDGMKGYLYSISPHSGTADLALQNRAYNSNLPNVHRESIILLASMASSVGSYNLSSVMHVPVFDSKHNEEASKRLGSGLFVSAWKNVLGAQRDAHVAGRAAP